jgi:histidine triad (HIT) family protein
VHLVPLNRMLDINFSQEKLKLSQESLAKTAELIRSFLI